MEETEVIYSTQLFLNLRQQNFFVVANIQTCNPIPFFLKTFVDINYLKRVFLLENLMNLSYIGRKCKKPIEGRKIITLNNLHIAPYRTTVIFIIRNLPVCVVQNKNLSGYSEFFVSILLRSFDNSKKLSLFVIF